MFFLGEVTHLKAPHSTDSASYRFIQLHSSGCAEVESAGGCSQVHCLAR